MNEIRPNRPPGPGPHRVPTGNYTQVNILFPSEQVELPSADKFKAFPPEAQKAILAAFDREQIERHAWLKNQQAYDHTLNMHSNRHYFLWRVTGTISGSILALALLWAGESLIKSGASASGITAMLVAIGGVVGSAVYGRRAAQSKNEKSDEQADQSSEMVATDPN